MNSIDSHHHLWDPRLRHYPWMAGLEALDRPFVDDDLRTAVAGTPVTGTIVVQADSSDEETDWLVGQAESSELIVGVVGWADLTSATVGDRLGELGERSRLVRGIRHQVHDETDPDWLLRTDVRAGLEAVRDAGFAFDLLIRRPESAAAATIAGAIPGLTFVVDHAAKPGIADGEWDAWHADLAALAVHGNVYCKLSGLVTEASWTGWREQHIERYVAAAIELFGPARCMFGSDWPVSLLAASYGDVFELAQRSTGGLSAAEQDSIFRGAATAAYRLD